jgi:hypothetical protein
MPKSYLYKLCMMDIPLNIFRRHIINEDFNIKLKVMALRDSPRSWLSLKNLGLKSKGIKNNKEGMHKWTTNYIPNPKKIQVPGPDPPFLGISTSNSVAHHSKLRGVIAKWQRSWNLHLARNSENLDPTPPAMSWHAKMHHDTTSCTESSVKCLIPNW